LFELEAPEPGMLRVMVCYVESRVLAMMTKDVSRDVAMFELMR
jgi:hypothetical protein